MQNYYIRIEDMPSLVSHQLSIIKYVVLKKNFFFLCVDRLIWTWIWTRTSLDSDSNLFGLGLDSDSNLFGLGLVLDSTKVDLTTALIHSILYCTFYLIAHFIIGSYFYFILTYIYSLVLCFIVLFLFILHCPLSGPVLTYISLLIIPCMIVYVTNNKEP